MENFFDQLDALYQAGDSPAVERYLLDCLQQESADSPALVPVLNELGAFYRGVGRFEASGSYFHQALNCLEKNGQQGGVSYATVLLNLAGTDRLAGEPERAIALFQTAMALLQENGQQDSYEYASVLNNLSIAYQQVGQLDAALALLYLRMGEIDEADRCVSQALRLFEDMTEENVHHAAALSAKGSVCYQKREFARAAAFYSDSLALMRRFCGENMEYAITCKNLSKAYAATGKEHESEEMQRRAQAILCRLSAPST